MSGPTGLPGHMMAGGINTGMPIDNSCRFNDDDSAKTGPNAWGAGVEELWTLSVWVKRGDTTGGTAHAIFGAGSNATNYTYITFGSDSKIYLFMKATSDIFNVNARNDWRFKSSSSCEPLRSSCSNRPASSVATSRFCANCSPAAPRFGSACSR